MAEEDDKSWDQTKALITALQQRDNTRKEENYGKVTGAVSQISSFDDKKPLTKDEVIKKILDFHFGDVERSRVFPKKETETFKEEYLGIKDGNPHSPAATPIIDGKIETNIKAMSAETIKDKLKKEYSTLNEENKKDKEKLTELSEKIEKLNDDFEKQRQEIETISRAGGEKKTAIGVLDDIQISLIKLEEQKKSLENKSRKSEESFNKLKETVIKHRPELKDDIEKISKEEEKSLEKSSTKQVESPENSINILGIKIPDFITKALQKAGVKAENTETSSSKTSTITPTAPGKSGGMER